MDWFTLFLVFIFFVLPLIQQIAEARKRSQLPPPPELEEGEEHPEARLERAPPLKRAPTPPREGGGAWSEGWGEWPGMVIVPDAEVEADEADEEEAVPEGRPGSHEESWTHRREVPAGVPAPRAEPVRGERVERVLVQRPAPVEPVEIDRRAEHRRFHERLRTVEEVRRPTNAAARRLVSALHDREELQRAILLAEVLGPPRSLRPLEGERG